MTVHREERSFTPAHRLEYTPQDVADRNKLAAILNMHADQLDAMVELQQTLDKVWRVIKWGTPIMIGALVASGAITGPLGKVFTFLAEHVK